MAEDKVKLQIEVPKEQLEKVVGEPAATAKTEEPAEKSKTERKEEPEVAGYKASQIAKAPLEPPEPESKAAPNPHQRRLIIFGCAIVLAGLLLWPLASFAIGLTVAIAGAAVVAFGTLVRI